MLKDGKVPPAIKIEENAIVDGHHRYISGHIFGVKPPKIDWIRPEANEIRLWNSVFVDGQDYENDYDSN